MHRHLYVLILKHISVCGSGDYYLSHKKTNCLMYCSWVMSEMVFTEASQIQTSIIMVAASGEKLRIGSLSSLLHILFDLFLWGFPEAIPKTAGEQPISTASQRQNSSPSKTAFSIILLSFSLGSFALAQLPSMHILRQISCQDQFKNNHRRADISFLK